ncbi:hypothetical protein N7G274_008874 [Stereocaulon virgatum]|uniref:Swi5-domain-containing protein n=1 Tax=Stereocaulon virgatum TaxID=373712 RepID=A0ABR4A0E5_9LECA
MIPSQQPTPMSSSPSSPKKDANPPSPHCTAPQEIPDSNPSSPASSPAQASNASPPAPPSEEASKPDLPASSASSEPPASAIPASSKPTSQEIQNTKLPQPPPQSPPINPQEAKKIATLKAQISALETQITKLGEKQKEIDAQLKTKDPTGTVKAHIKLLHDYNEIRDIGQGLMGIIADNRGVRVIDVYEEFGVGQGD